jgi:nitrate/nitrite transporter NarK
MFSATSFNYYLINFYLKYIPGNVYVNTMVASLADCVAHICIGALVKKLGSKNSFTGSFLITVIAGTLLWIFESREELTSDVPIVVLAAKFGAAAAFAMLYISTLSYFPSQYMGMVFGICNVTARSVTILAPMVAEAPEPVPELTMVLSFVLAAALSRCIVRESTGV